MKTHILLIGIIICLWGCTTPPASLEPSSTATLILPTATATPIPPTHTITPLPTEPATAAPTASPVPLLLLEKSAQEFNFRETFQAGLGDLDGDGDLDAVFANPQKNAAAVWLNDGSGTFADTGQELTQYGHGVGLADFDGDGDLDAFIACHQFVTPSKIYLNDGHGNFHDSGQDLGDAHNSAAEVNWVDLNGDGYTDVHVLYFSFDGLPDKVYLNDGSGIFTDSGLALDEETIAWGDLDGDGDTDYFGKRWGVGYVVQLNDGNGQFSEGWQLPDERAYLGGVVVADFDMDGDLDALVTNGFQDSGSYPSRLFWNDGSGQFTDSGQTLNETLSSELAIGDLDNDGDLDIFVANMDWPNEVWLNDGTGKFIDSGLRLGENRDMSGKPTLGDLDGDGDLDVIVGRFRGGAEIWLNRHADQAASFGDTSLPALQTIAVENAVSLQLLRTLKIPGYQKAQVSQCSLAFSPDNSLLVGACGNNRVPIWDVQSGQLIHTLYADPQQIVACAFSPDGTALACGGFDETITLWDARTGKQIGSFADPIAPIWDLAFSPDGASLAACSLGRAKNDRYRQGDVRNWNTSDGQLIWVTSGPQDYLSLSFHPADEMLAYGGLGGKVGILDAQTGVPLIELGDASRNIGNLAYSPSGRWLAAGSDGNLIYLWKTPDYALETQLKGHADYVNGVAFNPAETLLISGSHDETIGVWDFEGQKQITLLSAHTDAVLRVTFSPHGTLIASISWDGTVRLWGVPTE